MRSFPVCQFGNQVALASHRYVFIRSFSASPQSLMQASMHGCGLVLVADDD